jgi:preprotein translocase SecE subunit
LLKVRFLQGANYKEGNLETGMASKKKGKAEKNNTSSVLNSKNAVQPQKVIAQPVKARKAGHETKPHKGNNPAKAPEEISSAQPSTAIWRMEKNSPLGERFLKISQFLNEVLAEFRRINWPERSQVARETVSVLFLVLLITVLVWVFDLSVGKFVFSPLEHWGHLYGFGAKN